MPVKTTVFGYPKIGPQRELKKALEFYWNGKISQVELMEASENLILNNAKTIAKHGIDIIPSNEFSFYDFILDLSVMFNVIPERFREIENPLERYFAIARGTVDAPASEMTKWFNTNYHYIVPEIESNTEFEFIENKPLKEYELLKSSLNFKTKLVITGPFTYLYCAKVKNTEYFLDKIAFVYESLLDELEKNGVEEVQIDEPAMVLDLDKNIVNSIIDCYRKITANLSRMKIYVQTYYESLSAYEKLVYELPVSGIGFDFLEGIENLENISKFGFPKDKALIAGVVSGRDPWRTDFKEILKLIGTLTKFTEKIILSNSCPLIHLPVTIKNETFPKELSKILSFANERLEELTILKTVINEGKEPPVQDLSMKFVHPDVSEKVSQINQKALHRKPEFAERYKKQMEILKLPLFPTTTIGSFPQTTELRKARADYKAGRISLEEYENFINNEIKKAIEIQEKIGLDVLVHGEFERTDMVEFFAEKLQGFAITKNGWVQSYGSRCVRPPIIYGDVWRDKPLTLKETLYAQTLTKKPVKGILTGPVTILQWSYPRKDISKKEIAYQIALALNEEVMELEKAGIKIIQIDEPAFREGMPLKKAKVNQYFDWAIKSFRIVTHEVKPETQIHTHMCYSDFNDIIEKIYEMDADVISIEASRSKGEILKAFEKFRYDRGIGIGAYDIHSPRVPQVEEMIEIVERSIKLIDISLFWINPDCGLKTRGWKETIASLSNMVKVAKIIRREA
ncbi:5-methyltetrahydropteroyltriglutamate--homocysteine methyltransferase [Thermodesulfovibrio sp. N1]|uniref:5-methyltetrahydropteroyltriglutamate-- homocysteine S-methyltransferase n=1 Tax=Thermodesulfovibrio sp. N1 TaxID=1871110 RepID=UPI00083B4C81|nr:5-methyltetrahydropteroyltriglutamate--homocysteine S-methyltransferase [Thermodesulfovibrio sp. N1]ODA43520.1 5-methyltetrahydropteroyltriglutamate--homocysteine methyltransferase [Thermodesulfovibrio sp. N1]